jgi:hypothetical protein
MKSTMEGTMSEHTDIPRLIEQQCAIIGADNSFLQEALRRPSMTAALFERRRQMQQFGHDDMADAGLPVHALMNKARDYVAIACDRAHPGDRQDIEGAWKKMAQATALCLAALDRIAIEIGATAPPHHDLLSQGENA